MTPVEHSDRPHQLLAIAREIAREIEGFELVKGPGEGDLATHAFMKALRLRAIAEFDEDLSEKRICGSNAFAVDFYFPPERTIVEVAFGLPNPQCEFEKDILKAIMAQECGYAVGRLLFIGRPGAQRRSVSNRGAGDKGMGEAEAWPRDRSTRPGRRAAQAQALISSEDLTYLGSPAGAASAPRWSKPTFTDRQR